MNCSYQQNPPMEEDNKRSRNPNIYQNRRNSDQTHQSIQPYIPQKQRVSDTEGLLFASANKNNEDHFQINRDHREVQKSLEVFKTKQQ